MLNKLKSTPPFPPIIVGKNGEARRYQQPQAPTAERLLRKGESSVYSQGCLEGSSSPSLGLSSSTQPPVSKSDMAMCSLSQENANESQQRTGAGLEPGGRPRQPLSEPQFLVGAKEQTYPRPKPTPALRLQPIIVNSAGLFPHLKQWG